jgi:hypothetical protein
MAPAQVLPAWLALLRVWRLAQPEQQPSPEFRVLRASLAQPVWPVLGDWMSRKVEKACWEWS